MSAIRKQITSEDASDVDFAASARELPPEAFGYEDDVTPEAIEKLRADAEAAMSNETWTVIDGYVGKKTPASVD